MLWKYVKINEKFNLLVDHRKSINIEVYWLKVGTDSTYSIAPGIETNIDDNILIKELTFTSEGEYLIKVVTDDSETYERLKVYSFDDYDNNDVLNENLQLLQDIIASNNANTNDIMRMLKIINARL